MSSLIGEQILSNKEFTFDNSSLVQMMNPLSKEHSVLRQYLIPGLLEALRLNQSHKTSPVKLFETGKTYCFNKKDLKENSTGVTEKLMLGGVVWDYEENWFTNQTLQKKSIEVLFFSTKGILESFLFRTVYN